MYPRIEDAGHYSPFHTIPFPVEVQAWREHLAERVGRMRRGQGVLLSGRLFAESWLGQNGVKRYRLLVEADQVWERAWLNPPGLHKEVGLDVPEDAPPF